MKIYNNLTTLKWYNFNCNDFAMVKPGAQK